DSGAIAVVPHEGFLTSQADFFEGAGATPPWRMDAFYRHVRKRTGLLMEGAKPLGGRFSFDGENRKAWRGTPPPPEPPRFAADEVTHEVVELVRTSFSHHPGTVDTERLPATAAQAEALWRWALDQCVPSFGPYEDAMTVQSSGLFHTRISPLLNLHRLLPKQVVNEVAASTDIPLASREGFVRQVLGWREFVRHVHVATDGFRSLPERHVASAAHAGDGGFGRWRAAPWPASPHGGALPNALAATQPLPLAFWGTRSGLHCLDHVVASVWRDGWSHHITRLMVLSNVATLLGASPRELTDWFWVAYADAYDWVVEPNVLAMGTFAVGDVMTTKPYISGAAYIDKMSDFCGRCAFDPKKNCPVTRLYWAFLERNRSRLESNPRLFGPLASLRLRASALREGDARTHTRVSELLARGEVLTPGNLAP
ncbi:MAG: cryptochrome/photolyase family protein, partial [Myxococcaceae bacterium]|nr:cryptochrome/photolyase family protein [Myxococcaceae bacterium]